MSYKRSQVNEALQDLLDVFNKAAASKDGDSRTLNRKELHDLIEKELPSLMQPDFEKHFDDFFKSLEVEPGSNVDFREFMCLLATIVVCRDQAELQ